MISELSQSDFNLERRLGARRKAESAGALDRAAVSVLEHIREGCFQRSLCLIVAATSVASGLEVGYEHYKGSYSNPVMYTPVVLSGALAGSGLLGVFSGKCARTILRWVSVATLADGVIGFFFHVRGVARKPGGWSLPVTNIVMGPPIFAPLLFGTSAYLGLMASYLRREEDLHRPGERIVKSAGELRPSRSDWRADLRYGRFQKHLSAVTIAVGLLQRIRSALFALQKQFSI